MVQGVDPHPIIKLYFGDGNGGVDRSLLQNFIENPDARQDGAQIEEDLRRLLAFFEEDAQPLRRAQERHGREPGFVRQEERDALFIAAR